MSGWALICATVFGVGCNGEPAPEAAATTRGALGASASSDQTKALAFAQQAAAYTQLAAASRAAAAVSRTVADTQAAAATSTASRTSTAAGSRSTTIEAAPSVDATAIPRTLTEVAATAARRQADHEKVATLADKLAANAQRAARFYQSRTTRGGAQ